MSDLNLHDHQVELLAKYAELPRSSRWQAFFRFLWRFIRRASASNNAG